MVDFKNEQLYRQDSIDKQLKITFDSGTITNTEIPSEQFELTESLTSESQIVFGSCEASEIKFRIYNVFLPLKDKWLTVTQTLNGDTENPLQIGKYKVYSDKPTADRGYRDVVAYDAMYDIINTDVASWYNGLTFPMSLKAFRDSFFAFFAIEQEEVSLINDSMEIERTIDPSVLSGKDVIQSICQINGCFGHINRNGSFAYITLERDIEGLYPSDDLFPSNNLYPLNSKSADIDTSYYISADYEDYIVQTINKVVIRQQENDIGGSYGSGNNAYIVEDNFLVYGKSTEDLNSIAQNLYSVIYELDYRPFTAEVVGNPCFEVGDAITLYTKNQVVESYIMQRTLSGVQSLRDDFSAEGEEYQSEKVNDIQTQITQLKGKTNTLERTVDETKSTIADVESGLQSQITQTAESITSTVAKTQNNWDVSKLSFTITLFGYKNPQNVYPASEQYANQYYLNQTTGLVSVCLQNSPTSYIWNGKYQAKTIQTSMESKIEQTAESIRSEVSNIDKNLSSEIEQTAESIRLDVSDVKNELSAEIETNANQIALKVSKGGVSSQLSVESEQVTISGNRLVVDSDNFELNRSGYAKVGGEVEATSFSAYESINLRGGLQPGWGDYTSWHKVLYLGQNPMVPADPYLRSIASIDFFTQIQCTGTKSRIMSTQNYSDRLLYCYEMPSPFFGDIGHGVIGEDGTCYVDIDNIFAETIDTIQEYYVFLTPYKTDKTMFVKEKEHGYFIVQGEPNTEFDWEIKAKQIDYNVERLETSIIDESTKEVDYEREATNYLNEYEKELTSYEY